MKTILLLLSVILFTIALPCISRAERRIIKAKEDLVQLPDGNWVKSTDPRALKIKQSTVNPNSPEARDAKAKAEGQVQLPDGRWVQPTDPRALKIKQSTVNPNSPEARDAKAKADGLVQLPDGRWVQPNDPRVKK